MRRPNVFVLIIGQATVGARQLSSRNGKIDKLIILQFVAIQCTVSMHLGVFCSREHQMSGFLLKLMRVHTRGVKVHEERFCKNHSSGLRLATKMVDALTWRASLDSTSGFQDENLKLKDGSIVCLEISVAALD